MLTKEQIEKINYINLVNHTHFSIPMGIGNVKHHLKRAQACGFKGLAITDTHMMGGVLEAYKVCKEAKFPLAMGVVLNVIDDLERKDKTNKAFTLTAFAKNAVGYRNLVTLTSIGSQDDHFYYKPRVSLPELIEHSEGIVVMSGDINGMLAQSILRETGQEEVLMQIFKEHFNEDFFIEMHCHNLKMQWEKDTKVWVDSGSDPQKIVNLKLIELARKYKVKCVLVQNTYFPEPKHKALQEILIGNTPIGKDGWRPHESFHTRQLEDLYQMIQEKSNYISDEQFLEWTENSMLVLNKCKDIKLSFVPKLPNIKYEESVVNQDPIWEDNFQSMKTILKTLHPNMFELFEIAEEDISLKTSLKIMMKNAKVDFASIIHLDRLNEELRVIHRNGIIKLCDYFLLLEDVTHFVRSNGFLRGFGRGCLTGETKVITDKGFKNLKDMVEGDKVFTHKGNLKTVVKTFKYQVKEKLLEFKTENSWGNITLTKDHKIFGVKRELTKYAYDNKRKKYEEFEHKPDFYAAESFKVGDLLFVKTPDYVTKNLPDIDLASFIASEQNYKVFSKSIAVLNPLTGTEVLRFKREIKSSPEWVYLLGKWVGDGWYRYNEDKRRYDVGFAFNSKDTVEIERTIKFFEKHKFNVAKIEHKTKKLVQVVVYNKLLAQWFKSYFSEYKQTSGSKHLGDLKYLPKPLLTKLMKGYQSADGSISDNHYRQESVATTSPILVDDLKIAFIHLGIPVNITERQPYYRDNYLCNKSYTLKFMGLSRKRIARDYIVQEDGYYVKIKEIKEVKSQPVYDLMIGGEPSYTTSNFTVHNSGAGSLVAYALDITDCDPIHFDLLFERFLTKERVGKFNFELPNFPMNEYNKEKK